MTRAAGEILVVGGYGEVGRRVAVILAQAHAQSVIVAGRNPDRASEHPAKHIDVDDEASIDAALRGVELVVACVRQRQPHLLRAAARRGIAYTSIASPQMDASALDLSAKWRSPACGSQSKSSGQRHSRRDWRRTGWCP